MTTDQTTNNDGARLFLLGDTHGNVGRLQAVLAQSNGAQLLQLGDLGVGFSHAWDSKFATLSTQYSNFSFFAGNHDSPEVASRINGNLGRFGKVPAHIFPSSFFVSGGFSVDRDRRTVGVDYWPNEELDREEMELAEQEYVEAAPAYLFTHEAPSRLTEWLKVAAKSRWDVPPSKTAHFLDRLLSLHTPSHWYFGHWHVDCECQVGSTKFTCVGTDSVLEICHEYQKVIRGDKNALSL